MNVSFIDINRHITPMSEFKLNWRFTGERFDQLPDHDLDQLNALNEKAAQFVWKHYMSDIDLHKDFPFKKDYFKTIDQIELTHNNGNEIRKWLHEKGIEPYHQVFLSWEPDLAMMIPWALFIKYFDCFYYPGSDDLTVLDDSLNWALLCDHEEFLYFGTK